MKWPAGSSLPEPITDPGALLGEGPIWDDRSGRLWWVDIEGGLVHRTEPDSGRDDVVELGEPVGAAIPRRAGGWVGGMADGIAFFDESDVETGRTPVEADDPGSRMNDAACDPAGRLLTGTMTHGGRRSALYRVNGNGTVDTVFQGVGISNGLGWSPDGTCLYYVDTPTGQIDVFDYDLATGAMDDRRTLIDCTGVEGHPDGLTVDADGCLWAAFWDGWGLHRFDPTGTHMDHIPLPVARTTSCTFGGQDLDQLFVTTASTGLGEDDLAGQPLAGSLFRIDPGCVGLPTVPFDG